VSRETGVDLYVIVCGETGVEFLVLCVRKQECNIMLLFVGRKVGI